MEIVRTLGFLKALKRLGASASDLNRLELAIAKNPKAGDVIQGLQGARKVRFAMAGRGQRGGGRAIYVVIWKQDTAYLLLAYGKDDQDDLTAAQRKAIAVVIKELSE